MFWTCSLLPGLGWHNSDHALWSVYDEYLPIDWQHTVPDTATYSIGFALAGACSDNQQAYQSQDAHKELIKKQVIFSTLTAVLLVILFFAASIPSVNGCGTLSADYIPCNYTGRLQWNLQNGLWITLLIIWIIANVVYVSLARARRMRKVS